MKWTSVTNMKPDYIGQTGTQLALPDSLHRDLQQIDRKDPLASWRVCEAYMRHRFLPPLEWCDLPPMPEYTRTRWWVIAGCIESCSRAHRQAQGLYKKLKETRQQSRRMYRSQRDAAGSGSSSPPPRRGAGSRGPSPGGRSDGG